MRTMRKLRGTVFLLFGLFLVFTFISVADKAGSAPSGALIFFIISAPLAILGTIFTLLGIAKIQLRLGSADSRPLEHSAEAPDSNIEKSEKNSEPDQKAADLDARHFIKQTKSLPAGYVVTWVVVVPLLVYLTFKVFGGQLFEVFFR